MDIIILNERLSRIEKLLLGTKKVLTFEEACDYSGYKKSYMYKLTSSNLIEHSKPNGKSIFFSKDKLDAWLLSNRSKSSLELEQEANNYVLNHKR